MSQKRIASRSSDKGEMADSLGQSPTSDNVCGANQAKSESLAVSDSHRRRTSAVGLRGGRRKTNSIIDKLVARTIAQPNGCWEVQGCANRSGHVMIASGSPTRRPYIRVKAHILAWELEHKTPVPAGMVVMHTCDNPRCANPAHLKVGTQHDNILDSVHKGRYTAHHRTGLRLDGQPSRARRLSDDQQAELLAWLATGQSITAISRALGIGRKAIHKFRDRLTRKAS